jgi:hypothetical protein
MKPLAGRDELEAVAVAEVLEMLKRGPLSPKGFISDRTRAAVCLLEARGDIGYDFRRKLWFMSEQWERVCRMPVPDRIPQYPIRIRRRGTRVPMSQ